MKNPSIRYIALAAAFLSGACTMMVEVAAGRLVSRDLGNSIYTWTSIIGIVLGGLSLGNFLGGALADRVTERRRLLALAFLTAGLLVALIPTLNGQVGQWQFLWALSWPMRIFWHAVFVFLLPSIVLGLIGPITAKIMLDSVPAESSGRYIGLVYASGAVGSIVGTFFCGFVLIAQLGLPRLFVGVAFFLILIGLLLSIGSRRAVVASAVALSGTAAAFPTLSRDHFMTEDGVIYRAESRYTHITVVSALSNPNHRSLYLDRLKHTEMDIRRPQDLEYSYSWIFESVVNIKAGDAPKAVSALVLGGGGFAVPTYLAVTRPDSEIDTVEIDPAVVSTARDFFGYRESARWRTHVMDARVFLSRQQGPDARQWDFILGDLVNDYSVPSHLTTRETLQAVKRVLKPGGVFMMNLIDSHDHGQFLPSMLITFKSVFPHVTAISCSQDTENRDTFVILGSDEKISTDAVVANMRQKHPFAGRIIGEDAIRTLTKRSGASLLTDDFAPVDNMLATVISRDLGGKLERLFAIGVDRGKEGDIEGAIASFTEAVALCPGSEAAHYNLGFAYSKLGQLNEAVTSYDNALRIKPDHLDARSARASILAQVGQLDAAILDWNEVARINPDLPNVRDNLAIAYAMRGQLAVARQHWIAALILDPSRARTWHNLAMSYAQSKDGVAAALCLRQATAHEPGNTRFREDAVAAHEAVLSAGYPAKDLQTLEALSVQELLQALRDRKES